MRLSSKTRYGVRAVFAMAFHGEGGPTQARELARREDIPLRFLEQIFGDLKRAGLVESRRGPRGGYVLRRKAEEIRLGDIVRALQGPIEEMFANPVDEADAADGGAARGRRRGAGDAAPAGSKHVTSALWRELATQVTGWFDSVHLSDLVERGVALGVPRGERKRPMYFI